MSNRTKAAAVLVALAGGAAITVAYEQAAQQTASTIPEVAAESQGEMIRAAARLREMGVAREDAVASLAAATAGPPEAIRNLVGQRWQGGSSRHDPRQRYGRVGVLAPSAAAAAVEAAIIAAYCEPLTDPRGNRPPHPQHTACVDSLGPRLSERLCGVLNVEVGRGARWQALPGDRPLLQAAAEGAGGVYVEGPGYDEGNAAFDAEVASRGWKRCEEATP